MNRCYFPDFFRLLLKSTFLALSLLFSLSLVAQRIELSGGVNKNVFYDNRGNRSHYQSVYTSHKGYAIHMGVDVVMVGSWEFRFTLGYDKYGGGLYTSDGGNGGGHYTEAEVDKSVLSLGFFPVNFKIIDKIALSIGVKGSRLLHESFEGTFTTWNLGSPEKVYDLQDIYAHYSARYYFGLLGSVGYEFKLSDRMMIVPRYAYYYGLSHEFEQFPEETKSMRHYLSIGLTWDLNPSGGIIQK